MISSVFVQVTKLEFFVQKVSDVEKDGNQIINQYTIFSLSETETKSVLPPFLAVYVEYMPDGD